MKYVELTIHTTTEASEIISDIMWNYTDYGVTICDRADIIALQTMYLLKPVGYFDIIWHISAAKLPEFIPKQESTDIRNREKKT